MPSSSVATLEDPIEGTTAGEHMGHSEPPHPPSEITGYINGNVSEKVKINSLGVATVGSTTKEWDVCCTGTNSGGTVATGYSKIRIGGEPVAMVGSKVTAHNGTAHVESSSQSKIVVG